jgi:hypothetical protein
MPWLFHTQYSTRPATANYILHDLPPQIRPANARRVHPGAPDPIQEEMALSRAAGASRPLDPHFGAAGSLGPPLWAVAAAAGACRTTSQWPLLGRPRPAADAVMKVCGGCFGPSASTTTRSNYSPCKTRSPTGSPLHSTFGFCQTPRVLTNLEAWIHRRLRSYLWRQSQNGQNLYNELSRRGVPKFHAAVAAGSPTGFWRIRTPGGPTGPAQPLLRLTRSPPTLFLFPSLTQSNRRGTDPYARWCGRGGTASPAIPINQHAKNGAVGAIRSFPPGSRVRSGLQQQLQPKPKRKGGEHVFIEIH